jgi:sulfur transfer complex TusBCD TusB component (DsrH family)
MSQVKKIARLLILLLFASCRLFRSPEQNAIHDIDKLQRKLNGIYAEFPQFRKVDTVETFITIDNPIKEIDTVVLYQDTVIIEEVYNTIIRSCKDTSLAKKVAKKVSNYRCIKDSIVVKDSLYKAVVRQDSLGIHVNIYPNDSTLSLKYKIPCTKNVIVGDEYWQHKEFWFLLVILLFTIAIVILKIRF